MIPDGWGQGCKGRQRKGKALCINTYIRVYDFTKQQKKEHLHIVAFRTNQYHVYTDTLQSLLILDIWGSKYSPRTFPQFLSLVLITHSLHSIIKIFLLFCLF